MRRPATGMHRPASPRPTCSVDVRLAGEGDKLARQRLHQEKYRAGKRRREIALFDARGRCVVLTQDLVRVRASLRACLRSSVCEL